MRLEAVHDMMRSPDEATLELLREQSRVETNAGVRKEISVGLALVALDDMNPQVRLDAVRTLRAAPARMFATSLLF